MHYDDHREPEIEARGMTLATWVFALAVVAIIMLALNFAS